MSEALALFLKRVRPGGRCLRKPGIFGFGALQPLARAIVRNCGEVLPTAGCRPTFNLTSLEIPAAAGEMLCMASTETLPAPRAPIARPPLKAGDHLILVDGSTFMFRAFFAIQTAQRMSRADGLPTGAVLVFCNMIWKLLQEGPTPEPGDEPTHFAVVFDYSAKTFRNEIYTDYKAHRPEPPADLIPQFGLIRQATRAFKLPMIEQEGWEADDLIATYAIEARQGRRAR